MKPWRLTPQAEESLSEIFIWTIEKFGERQAVAYQDALIFRINAIAQNKPPHPRPCAILMQGRDGTEGLSYIREAGHFIILREINEQIEILEFLHQSSDLPNHLKRLAV